MKFKIWGVLFILSLIILSVQAQERIYPFAIAGKIGYKDAGGNVIIEPQFQYAEEFGEGMPWTVVGTGDYELLNHSIDRREVNFYGKFGLISNTGKIIFEPVFTLILKLEKETAVVGNGNGYLHFTAFPDEKNHVFDGDMGVVSISGDTIIPMRFTQIQSFAAGGKTIWYAARGDSSFLFSQDNRYIISGKIMAMYGFNDGLARVETPSGYGFIDTVGHFNIEPGFEKAADFQNGSAFVKDDGNYFVIDEKGELKKPEKIRFDEVGPFSEGLARVRIFDEYGYIYPDSTFFIVPEFNEAGNFFNGIAAVATADSFGYLHPDGRRDLVKNYNTGSGNSVLDNHPVPAVLDSLPSVPCECLDSVILNDSFDTLDLALLINLQAEALRYAPFLYYRYPQMLEKVSAGEGTLAGRFDFNLDFMKPGNPVWEKFREDVLFRLIRNHDLHPLIWDWVEPVYKQVFLSMPEKHRSIYIRMLDYLVSYFADYPADKVEHFLMEHPEEFAHRHWNGTYSPFRKVSAFLERLVMVHKVIELQDVKYWIEKIAMAVKSWEKQS